MPMLPENQLSYYSARLLKEALREMGYVFPKNITKKQLIQYITDLIQQSGDLSSSSDSEYSSDSEEGLVFKCTYSE
jgi:hypothetical protein